jgi:hypothetical protein
MRTVLAQRGRLVRALLTTTLLAQGTPMLLAGDELGHTQRGNNNAYCQDNDLSWIDWTQADDALIEFTARVIALRRQWPALRQDRWLTDGVRTDGARDARWLAPQRDVWREMTLADWHDPSCHAFGLWLSPPATASVLLWVNAQDVPLRCALPPGRWRRLLDTARPELPPRPGRRHEAAGAGDRRADRRGCCVSARPSRPPRAARIGSLSTCTRCHDPIVAPLGRAAASDLAARSAWQRRLRPGRLPLHRLAGRRRSARLAGAAADADRPRQFALRQRGGVRRLAAAGGARTAGRQGLARTDRRRRSSRAA